MGGLQVRQQMLEATFTTRRFWNAPQATQELSNLVDKTRKARRQFVFLVLHCSLRVAGTLARRKTEVLAPNSRNRLRLSNATLSHNATTETQNILQVSFTEPDESASSVPASRFLESLTFQTSRNVA